VSFSHTGLKITDNGVREAKKLLDNYGINPDVIFIDSLCRTIEGSENSSQDTSPYWSRLREWSREEITIIVNHHTPKVGMSKTGTPVRNRTPRGSGDMLAGVDNALYLERSAKDLISVAPKKLRIALEHKPFVVSVLSEGIGRPMVFIYVDPDEELAEGASLKHLVYDFVWQRPDHTAAPKDILPWVLEGKYSSQALERALRQLVKDGSFEKRGRGIYVALEKFPREESLAA
jgi:hypothetical protein